MDLPEAMRLGAMSLPATTWFDGCPLGCAAFAVGKNYYHGQRKGQSAGKGLIEILSGYWPELQARCGHPLREDLGLSCSLASIIMNLNDRYRWPREQTIQFVEDWLARQAKEVPLAVQAAQA